VKKFPPDAGTDCADGDSVRSQDARLGDTAGAVPPPHAAAAVIRAAATAAVRTRDIDNSMGPGDLWFE
jgi:hypothetical protein